MQVLKEKNYTPMKYLITGATGNIGALVVERLLGWGHRPRVFVRDTAKARALHGPCVDISVGDLADAESIATALRGIDTIFLINSGPDLVARDDLAARIAKAAGTKRIVKLSTMDVEQRVGTGVWHVVFRGEVIPFLLNS
jgi:uncharacterized protein YbjT (DUF2867 family)